MLTTVLRADFLMKPSPSLISVGSVTVNSLTTGRGGSTSPLKVVSMPSGGMRVLIAFTTSLYSSRVIRMVPRKQEPRSSFLRPSVRPSEVK